MPASSDQVRELAATIAAQATAIAEGTATGPLYAHVCRLDSNVQMLRAWVPDDRS